MASCTQECHICLEELRTNLVAAPCGHVFHSECIYRSFAMKAQCPLCRSRSTKSRLIPLFLEIPEPQLFQHDINSNTSHFHSNNTTPTRPTRKLTSCHSDSRSSIEKTNIRLTEEILALQEKMKAQNYLYERVLTDLNQMKHEKENLHRYYQDQMIQKNQLERNYTQLTLKLAKSEQDLIQERALRKRSERNNSIVQYIESCDATVLEEDISNPRELILALKKACKFRHEMYEKVVAEKNKLKKILVHTNNQSSAPTTNTSRRKHKHTNGSEVVVDLTQSRVKRRKMTEPRKQEKGFLPMDKKQHAIEKVVKKKEEWSEVNINERLSVYSDISLPQIEMATISSEARVVNAIQPAMISTFQRSELNPNQYGRHNLRPAREAPTTFYPPSSILRKGYDQVGNAQTFIAPKRSLPSMNTQPVRKVHQAPLRAWLQD